MVVVRCHSMSPLDFAICLSKNSVMPVQAALQAQGVDGADLGTHVYVNQETPMASALLITLAHVARPKETRRQEMLMQSHRGRAIAPPGILSNELRSFVALRPAGDAGECENERSGRPHYLGLPPSIRTIFVVPAADAKSPTVSVRVGPIVGPVQCSNHDRVLSSVKFVESLGAFRW
ncbi:hypothetical protein BHE74_00016159 [Ensete ventricosum]|nr:hypothetical protein BHE74_00016159 [Ensete ventricosum]